VRCHVEREGGVGARGGGALREKHGRKRSRGRGGEATAFFFPGRMGWERRIGIQYIFVGPAPKEKPRK